MLGGAVVLYGGDGLFLFGNEELVASFFYERFAGVFSIAGATDWGADSGFGAEEFTVFLRLNGHIVVLHDEIYGQFAPAVNHLVGKGDGVGVEVFYGCCAVYGIKLLRLVFYGFLVGVVGVFERVAYLFELRVHHVVARINHVAYPVTNPECVFVGEGNVVGSWCVEAFGLNGASAVDWHVSHHVCIVVSEPYYSADNVG